MLFTDSQIEDIVRRLVFSGQYPSYARAAEDGLRCEQKRFVKLRDDPVEESVTPELNNG